METWKERVHCQQGRINDFLNGKSEGVLSTNEFKKDLPFTANDNESRPATSAHCPLSETRHS